MKCIDAGRLLTAGGWSRTFLTGQEAGTLPGSRYTYDGECTARDAARLEAAV